MRHLASSASVVLALLLVACGGAVSGPDGSTNGSSGGGGGGGGGNGGGGGGGGGPLGIEGSFDVSFDAAAAKQTYPGGPPAPSDAPPSVGAKARIDIRKASGGYEAVFTSRWGTPAAYSVAVSDAAVTLTGRGFVSSSTGFGGTSDEWDTIVLARDASGNLTGKLTGTGKENISEGDVVWNLDLSGSGSLAKDATAPELKAQLTSRIGPTDALLPWDPIYVTAAEPVDADGVTKATMLVGGAGGGQALQFDPVNPDAAVWSGQAQFTAHVSSWPTFAAGGSWTLSNGGTLAKDLVGLSAPALSTPIKFLALGAPSTTIGFDDDVMEARFWGDYAVYGGGLTGQTDPRCEAGGCARIGPGKIDVCAMAHAGLAAMLTRGPLSHVSVRYRVLAKPSYEGGPSPYVYGNVLSVELAAAGAPTVQDDGAGTPTMQQLAAPIDGMTYGSDWITYEAGAPGNGAIGVAVALGGGWGGRGCGGPPPPPSDVEILVESITSK